MPVYLMEAYQRACLTCHAKTGPHNFCSPDPNISKHLDTQIIYFNFAEIFRPLELKFLKYLDRFEIFYPPSVLNQISTV